MKSDHLIQSLIEQTKQNINQVEYLKNENLETLKWKSNDTSWNILECLEHLNLYGEYYLTEIDIAISKARNKSEETFRPGFWGNYFSKSMLPKNKLKKMKTFKDKNPIHSALDKELVLDKFIHQQNKMLDLLDCSRTVNLNKTKVKTFFSSLIHLKLGDAFQFVINHNIRHLEQIDKIKSQHK